MPKKPTETFSARAMPLTVLPNEGLHGKAEQVESRKKNERLLCNVTLELRDACNAMANEWLGYHYIAGSRQQLAAKTRGVVPVPPDCLNRMYRACKDACPTAAQDVVTSTLQWFASTIKQQTSPRDNCKRWLKVLSPTRSERAWHFEHGQPIRLTKVTSQVESIGGEHFLVAKVVKGEPAIRFKIKGTTSGSGSNGRKYNMRLDALLALPHLNGSQLFRSKHGWQLVYVSRAPISLPAIEATEKTLLIRTSNEAGLRLRYNGQSVFMLSGDTLGALGDVRREVMQRRAELKAEGARPQSRGSLDNRDRWQNYCKTLYQQAASEIVSTAEKHGVTRIAFMAGDEFCTLGAIGNDEMDPKEPTRFPFHGFARQLMEKSQAAGIECVTRPNLRSVKRRKELRDRSLQLQR